MTDTSPTTDPLRQVWRWGAVAGVATGNRHRAAGEPCQDSTSFTRLEPNGLVAAVADGAGTAALAEVGSRTAVGTVERLTQNLGSRSPFDGSLSRTVRAIYLAAHLDLLQCAKERNCPVRELHTTLSVAIIGPDRGVLGRVGDGLFAVARRGYGIINPLPLTEEREYANETNFVTQQQWPSNLFIHEFEVADVDGVSLSSDGLRMVATADARQGTPYVPFYEDLFEAVRHGANSQSVSNMLSELNDRTGDDKSLIAIVRRGQPS